jgi:hypothetical protein
MLDVDGGEFGAAECAGEAGQQQRAVAQPGEVGFDRCRSSFRVSVRALGGQVGGTGRFDLPGRIGACLGRRLARRRFFEHDPLPANDPAG